MPLLTLDKAPNWTAQFKFKYTHFGQKHVMGVRMFRGWTGAVADVVEKMASVGTALEHFMFSDFSFLDGVWIPEDEFASIPLDISSLVGITGTSNPSGVTNTMKSLQMRFEIRGDDGGLGSLSLFSPASIDTSGAANNDWRITSAENSNVAAVITALNELAPRFAVNRGASGNFREYANIKFNDYWRDQTRG